MPGKEHAQRFAENAGLRKADIALLGEYLLDVPDFLLSLLENPESQIEFKVTGPKTVTGHEATIYIDSPHGLHAKVESTHHKSLPQGSYTAYIEKVTIIYPSGKGANLRAGTCYAIVARHTNRAPKLSRKQLNGYAWFHQDISVDTQ